MIEAKGLTKRFGDFQALNHLDLHVKTGSIYGLIGVNGSGKTTILKTLTGILIPDSGEALMDGQPVMNNESIKARLGFIPDELYFYGNYSMKNMADFYKGIYPRWDSERFYRMLGDFELPAGTRIGNFSKGMQKQAAFILVMSHRPDFLVLDEPIDGLDPLVRKKVWSYVVDDVAERAMSVLVSSHNLREMEGICDSIGIISKGEMKIEQDLDELKSDIHKVQVAFDDDEKGMEALERLNMVHHETRGSVHIAIIREKREKVEEVIGEASPKLMDILPLSLEEVFIYEMGGENSDVSAVLK